MPETLRATTGRPRLSSRDTLADAASELFVERTYAETTIDDIARRAGVSRNTFFNYFRAKSDLLWIEADESLAHLDAHLAASPADTPLMDGIRDALLAVAAEFGPGRLPLALGQDQLIGIAHEVDESALSRFHAPCRSIADFAARRLARQADDPLPRTIAMTVLAAAAAAAVAWARAGTSRGPLAPYVRDAVLPVCAGFQALLDGSAAPSTHQLPRPTGQ